RALIVGVVTARCARHYRRMRTESEAARRDAATPITLLFDGCVLMGRAFGAPDPAMAQAECRTGMPSAAAPATLARRMRIHPGLALFRRHGLPLCHQRLAFGFGPSAHVFEQGAGFPALLRRHVFPAAFAAACAFAFLR